MVNYAWIQRIPPTTLTQIFIEAVGAKDELDLMEGLSNQQYHPFPFLAIQILDAARAGDAAARDPPHDRVDALPAPRAHDARQRRLPTSPLGRNRSADQTSSTATCDTASNPAPVTTSQPSSREMSLAVPPLFFG